MRLRHLFRPADDRELDKLHKAVTHLTTLVTQQGKTIMAQIDDLNAAIAEEDKDIDAILALAHTEVTEIADLQAQLAAAIAAGGPDLSGLIADAGEDAGSESSITAWPLIAVR